MFGWLFGRNRAEQPPAPRLAIEREFPTMVVGVSHKNPDGTKRQEIIEKFVTRNRQLILAFEDSNPKDKNAVAVHVKNVGQIGYLDRNLAKQTRDLVAKGKTIKVRLDRVVGGEPSKPSYGVALIYEIWSAEEE
jgi:hypothetical protein